MIDPGDERDREFLRAVAEAEQQVKQAELQLEAKTRERKVAKEIFEEALERLRSLIREEAEGFPLFGERAANGS